jgi:hypothetical protein
MPRPSVAYALDFDGVICDSVGESSLSAYKTLARVWPGLEGADASTAPEWLLDAMRAVRPVVETGYENVLLARALLERGRGVQTDAFVADALSGNWPATRDALLSGWNVRKDDLVDAFGSVRDEWIAEDSDTWVAANKFFPGVVDALNFSATDLYILTTKQQRFVTLLLKSYGVRTIPDHRIFGYGTGTKISILKQLIAMPENGGKKIVFVEDRFETLEAVSISMLGQPLELYLASWGYNTEASRKTASKHPYIPLIDLATFVNKLQ